MKHSGTTDLRVFLEVVVLHSYRTTSSESCVFNRGLRARKNNSTFANKAGNQKRKRTGIIIEN